MSLGLGARLREARQKNNTNQADFARLGGVGLTMQREYETGKTAPNSDYLSRLNDSGIDVTYILTGRFAADSLSEEETSFLQALRVLSNEWRAILLAAAARAAADFGHQSTVTLHERNDQFRDADNELSSNIVKTRSQKGGGV